MSRRRVITMEVAQRIADIMRSDVSRSMASACQEVGVTPHTVQCGLTRYRTGKALEEEHDIMATLSRGLEDQCANLIREGCEAAKEGRSASWYSWLLSKKSPHAYGDLTKIAVVDSDGEDLSALTTDQLRAIVAAATPGGSRGDRE